MKIIEDILDVSRVISGKLKLESQPTDLAAVTREALAVVRPSATAKRINLELVAEAGPLPARGRPGSPAASGLEPLVERGEVHRVGRTIQRHPAARALDGSPCPSPTPAWESSRRSFGSRSIGSGRPIRPRPGA